MAARAGRALGHQELGHGRVTRLRGISIAAILSAVPLWAAPPIAGANSLLSGYGGPGQGSQAILGATLLNGPGSGSGGGSGGVAVSAAAAGAGSATGTGTATSTGASHSSRGSARQSRRATATRGGSAVVGAAAAAAVLPSASQENAVHAATLGITAADLLLAIAGVALVLGVAVLTRRLAQEPREGPG